MSLDSNPPHRVDTYTQSNTTDTGGGTSVTYTLAQSSVPCSINTATSSEQLMFAQQGQVVTHTIGFRTDALTTALVRGMKLIESSDATQFHVKGISAGRTYGGIAAFTYAYCESQN